MKIKKMQINAFGNIQNKTIELEDGINVISGDNESGKSTITYFIKSIFYGINKLKNRSEFSEQEKYKPWSGQDFSGKIDYELDGKTFSAVRDFTKNACKIYDESGNDITSEFPQDKSRGAELGKTHFGVDEETFLNTLFVPQKDIEVEIDSQKNVIQKLANILQSGHEGVSLEKIKTKLQKKILDEVGTDRTHNKPINQVTRDIYENEQLKNKLINNRFKKEEIDNQNKELIEQIKSSEEEMIQIEKVLAIKSKYVEQIEEKEKTYELTRKIKEKEKQEKIAKAKREYNLVIVSLWIIIAIICVLLCIYKKYIWIPIEAIVAVVASVVLAKTNKVNINTESLPDLTIIKEEINKKEKKELGKLLEQGVKNSYLDKKVPELKMLYQGIEKKRKDLIIDQHKNKLEEDAISENIEKLSEIEENLSLLYEEKNALKVKSKIINLALDKLSESYDELKAEVVPEMERSIKAMIAQTTGGKYTNAIYNHEEGILLENAQGNLIPVSKLSIGTIDQIYLGFRLGISKRVADLPIILDESFAYYDENRLLNILKTLESLNRQVIIMSCSNREVEALSSLNIRFNNIKI